MGPKQKKDKEAVDKEKTDKAKAKEAKDAEKARKAAEKAEKAKAKADKDGNKKSKKDAKASKKDDGDPTGNTKSTRADDQEDKENKEDGPDIDEDCNGGSASKARKLNDGSRQPIEENGHAKENGKAEKPKRNRSKKDTSAAVEESDEELKDGEKAAKKKAKKKKGGDDDDEEFKDFQKEFKEDAPADAKADKKPAKEKKEKKPAKDKDGKEKDGAKKKKDDGKKGKDDTPQKKPAGGVGAKEAKKPEKAVIMDVPDTKVKIEEFMLRNNRPYSTQDILNCYQSSMRKKQADQALDELTQEKKITTKEYGKAKVFLVNQDRFPKVDTALLDALDEQMNLRRIELNELVEQNKQLDKQVKEVTSTSTNQQLTDLVAKLKIDNEDLEKRVNAFKTGGIQLISEDDLQEAAKEQIYYAQNWKKLKRGCSEMIDTITEAVEMNTKEYIKGLGLETDEDYGVDLKALNII